METEKIRQFLKEIQGHRYENLYFVALFSGVRESEALGLSWDCIDFSSSSILINKQLLLIPKTNGKYELVPTKNGKERVITLAPAVMDKLANQKNWQESCKKAKVSRKYAEVH